MLSSDASFNKIKRVESNKATVGTDAVRAGKLSTANGTTKKDELRRKREIEKKATRNYRIINKLNRQIAIETKKKPKSVDVFVMHPNGIQKKRLTFEQVQFIKAGKQAKNVLIQPM